MSIAQFRIRGTRNASAGITIVVLNLPSRDFNTWRSHHASSLRLTKCVVARSRIRRHSDWRINCCQRLHLQTEFPNLHLLPLNCAGSLALEPLDRGARTTAPSVLYVTNVRADDGKDGKRCLWPILTPISREHSCPYLVRLYRIRHLTVLVKHLVVNPFLAPSPYLY